MEMSPEYMRKTALALKDRGFELSEETQSYGEIPEGRCDAQRYILTRPEVHLVLEVVKHPVEGTRYFLELVKFHELSMTSFLLDSWKFFKDRVEFKFYALPSTGMGLSFILR